MDRTNDELSDSPLVAPSYNHTSEDRAAMGIAGAICMLGALALLILAACGVI